MTAEPRSERPEPPDDAPRVALVGGPKLMTEALSWMLSDDGNLVVGTYPSATALLSAYALAPPNVVMIDADDAAAGLPAVSEIRRHDRDVSIVLLVSSVTAPVIRAAIEEPLQAVVLKTDSSESVLSALHHLLGGRSVLPAGWHEVLESDLVPGLSRREREILELLAAGLQNQEIAQQLVISVNTVKFHLRSIYARLGVRNRVEAVQALGNVEDIRSAHNKPGTGSS